MQLQELVNSNTINDLHLKITKLEQERDELRADYSIAKIHLEQKDKALAANAKEYAKLGSALKASDHLIKSLSDQLETERELVKITRERVYQFARSADDLRAQLTLSQQAAKEGGE